MDRKLKVRSPQHLRNPLDPPKAAIGSHCERRI
jgi:hypothetical protein